MNPSSLFGVDFSDDDDSANTEPAEISDINEIDNNNSESIRIIDEEGDDEESDDDFFIYENEIPLISNDNNLTPSLNKWKELSLFDPIILTVSKAKRSMWIQAKQEVQLIKNNINEIKFPSDVTSAAPSPLYKVYQTLFGTNSLLSNNFCRYLDITKREYLLFIFSFIVSCKNQQAISVMHKSREINREYLMSVKDYNVLWCKIRDYEGTLRQESFWKIIENSTNQQLRMLFLSNEEDFPYLFGFNDDKLHFAYGRTTKMEGLSPQHHVKDNRRGLTLHTCAYPATCVPVAVRFQRLGESVQATYVRTMREIFGIGYNGHLQLRGVTLASDRGYWEKALLFKDFLEGGANVVGTVKRVRAVVVFFAGCCFCFCRRRMFCFCPAQLTDDCCRSCSCQ